MENELSSLVQSLGDKNGSMTEQLAEMREVHENLNSVIAERAEEEDLEFEITELAKVEENFELYERIAESPVDIILEKEQELKEAEVASEDPEELCKEVLTSVFEERQITQKETEAKAVEPEEEEGSKMLPMILGVAVFLMILFFILGKKKGG